MKRLFLLSTLWCCALITFASTYYLDPVNGDLTNNGSSSSPWPSLEEVISNKMISSYQYSLPYNDQSTLLPKNVDAPIKGGDTLILLDGLHGSIFLQNYHNDEFINLMADAESEPILKSFHIQSGSKWRLIGLTISREPYGEYGGGYLVNLQTHGWQGPATNIDLLNCYLYSTDDWTVDDWLQKVSSGINLGGDNINVDHCYIKNISFGVSCVGDSINVRNTTVENFSGDGMRTLGRYILIESNVIKNCYDIDENHDDGIQSFNLGTYDTRDITIRNNIILNYEDPNQPLLGPLQGIGCFDGPFHNWVIENNIVSVNHWHGISLYGAFDCVIRNNTVIDPTPEETPGSSWIRINPHKDGTESENNIVANNLTNKLALSGSTSSGNIIVNSSDEYPEYFEEYETYNFRLIPGSPAIDAAVDSLASTFDILDIPRPQGLHSDVGAYEFIFTEVEELISEQLEVYPNPTMDWVYFKKPVSKVRLLLSNGQLIQLPLINNGVNMSNLPSGIYYLQADGEWVKVFKI